MIFGLQQQRYIEFLIDHLGNGKSYTIMKGVVFHGNGDIRLEDVPEQEEELALLLRRMVTNLLSEDRGKELVSASI